MASTEKLAMNFREQLQRRADQTAAKFESVETDVYKLERNVAIEQRRRAEADSQLETEAERVLGNVAHKVEESLDKQLDILTRNIAIVTAKVDEMFTSVVNDRQKTEEALQLVRNNNANALSDVQHTIEQLRSERLANEVKVLKQLKTETQQMMERITIESQVRENIGIALHDLLSKAVHNNAEEEALDKQKVDIIEMIEGLREELTVEIDERQEHEENFAGTMQDLIQQFTVGVRQAAR